MSSMNLTLRLTQSLPFHGLGGGDDVALENFEFTKLALRRQGILLHLLSILWSLVVLLGQMSRSMSLHL
jgi:hypothetical protein